MNGLPSVNNSFKLYISENHSPFREVEINLLFAFFFLFFLLPGDIISIPIWRFLSIDQPIERVTWSVYTSKAFLKKEVRVRLKSVFVLFSPPVFFHFFAYREFKINCFFVFMNFLTGGFFLLSFLNRGNRWRVLSIFSHLKYFDRDTLVSVYTAHNGV